MDNLAEVLAEVDSDFISNGTSSELIVLDSKVSCI